MDRNNLLRSLIVSFILATAAGFSLTPAVMAGPDFSLYKQDTASQICYDPSGKLILREFSASWCSDCTALTPLYNQLVQSYGSRIVSYSWVVDKQSVPAGEEAIYSKYSPNSSIPTFVFGCKYYMIGSASQKSTWLNASTAVVDYLLSVGPTSPVSPTKPVSPTSRAAKAGDANGDGKVDGTDYVVWLTHFSQTTTAGQSAGDFDGSGKVDGLDYIKWLNNFGK